MDQVILVDEHDNEIGTMEKLEAHRKGLLHRAFSVLLFNSQGDLLLQKRAKHKYHSGGLWSNACCSHPRPGEPMKAAVTRRLREELGVAPELTYSHKFLYRVDLEDNLSEHELDYVYIGYSDESPNVNPLEVTDWKYVPAEQLKDEVDAFPDQFTYWFKLILGQPEIKKFLAIPN